MFVPQVKLDEFNKMLVNISSRLQAPEIKLTDILSSPKLGEVLKANSDYFVSKLSQHAARKDLNPSNLVEEVKNPFVYAAAARLQEILNDPVSYQYLCRSFGIQGRPSDGNIRKGVNDLLEDLKKSGK
ncbi:hypothetical protein AGDE_02487 [Angomonas deanei]|nr:hypothetical protein AGDE_02487 [Angomonas deanei]|eukprot:EPY41437.1 hypothetical protein AGDE_02487 [Angomonas deanei]